MYENSNHSTSPAVGSSNSRGRASSRENGRDLKCSSPFVLGQPSNTAMLHARCHSHSYKFTLNFKYLRAVSDLLISFLHTCMYYVAIDRSDHASCDLTTPTSRNTVSLPTDEVNLLPMHGSSHVHVHQLSLHTHTALCRNRCDQYRQWQQQTMEQLALTNGKNLQR